jgi:LDH2 family malate/lactate/ureidoglycolate dehydrogenase
LLRFEQEGMATMDVRVSHNDLTALLMGIFRAKGMSAEDAATAADVLVWAELRGVPSHGVVRVPSYLAAMERGKFDPKAQPVLKPLAAAAFLLDCAHASGAVAMMAATKQATEVAARNGIGIGLIRNTTHTGAIGRYAEWAAERGFAAIVISVGIMSMAYHGARVPGLATAPIAIGVPGDRRGPIVLDMATAIAAMGRVRQAMIEGKPLPEGWALDSQGKPTVDPAAAETILPLGGPKGAGLALMFEFLTSVLAGNLDIAGGRRTQDAMVIALNVAAFRPLAAFARDVDALGETIKSLPRFDGIDEILLPGERGNRVAADRRQAGIPIAAKTWKQLSTAADSLAIPVPKTA